MLFPLKEVLILQYSLVQDARKVLIEFLSQINATDFIRTSENFGNGGSIKSLMVHICNSYFGWMSHFAFQRPFDKVGYDSVNNLKQCSEYFSKVDVLVDGFLGTFNDNYEKHITGTIANGTRTITTTPLIIFMHVITHEFHHKGQILSLSRSWGYLPVDTDILR